MKNFSIHVIYNKKIIEKNSVEILFWSLVLTENVGVIFNYSQRVRLKEVC